VRRGVLSVHAGREVAIATRQAQVGDDLASLEQAVLARFRAEQDADRQARVAATRLHTAAIREIIRALSSSQAMREGAVTSPSPALRERIG
jgi:F-type H+-transporting ATPase subunit epsilon